MKFVAPSDTTSLLPGGMVGTPETATQFAAVSHAVLTEPFQATIFGLSETVQRPVMSARESCSTQLLTASLAVSPETVQGGSKRKSRRLASEFPLSSESS